MYGIVIVQYSIIAASFTILKHSDLFDVA